MKQCSAVQSITAVHKPLISHLYNAAACSVLSWQAQNISYKCEKVALLAAAVCTCSRSSKGTQTCTLLKSLPCKQ